ncbi:MAG: hypothetical protein QG656_1020 [Candidatus Hydrogenedentes bacterium]|nr:hypothetical protein [Candidatus Hydrogenedentota bacterium]
MPPPSQDPKDDRHTEALIERVAAMTAANDRLLSDAASMISRWGALRAQFPSMAMQAAAVSAVSGAERAELVADLEELDAELSRLEESSADHQPPVRSMTPRSRRSRV